MGKKMIDINLPKKVIMLAYEHSQGIWVPCHSWGRAEQSLCDPEVTSG